MSENNQYHDVYSKFVAYQEIQHEKNQNKIRVGLKVNIFLPLVFLIISFLSKGSKLVFLILWIVSLFGIAFYLIYIEYSDYKAQEKLKEFGVLDANKKEEALIGEAVVMAEALVNEKVDIIDQKLDEERKRIEESIEEKLAGSKRAEKLREIRAGKKAELDIEDLSEEADEKEASTEELGGEND